MVCVPQNRSMHIRTANAIKGILVNACISFEQWGACLQLVQRNAVHYLQLLAQEACNIQQRVTTPQNSNVTLTCCLCCSAEVDITDDNTASAGIRPCAVKTLPYFDDSQKMSAAAELRALWDAYEYPSVMTCFGVFEDTDEMGLPCLRIITE